jgi:hypothetical protein
METQSSAARLGQADPFRTLNPDCRAGLAIDRLIDGPVILPWGRLGLKRLIKSLEADTKSSAFAAAVSSPPGQDGENGDEAWRQHDLRNRPVTILTSNAAEMRRFVWSDRALQEIGETDRT